MFLILINFSKALFLGLCFLSYAGAVFEGSETPMIVKQGEYRQIRVNEKLKKVLGSNRFLEMAILNKGREKSTFFLVMEDSGSAGYWSRLNFKTTLVPGLNKVVFDLKRQVGERGSSKTERRLDYGKLKKVFVSLDPDKKSSLKKALIKDMRLLTPPALNLPKGALFFDFAGNGMPSANFKGARVVTEGSSYSKSKKHGFALLDLWKARDSVFAPEALSSSLSVNKAVFQVDLPPGTYHYELIWDELGYWEPPFWKDRLLTVNGKPRLKESRISTRDYLRDALSLREEPPNGASAAEFYIDKAFKPVTGEFKSDGKAFFAFEGDPTGASLNTLFIWPADKAEEAAYFKKALRMSYKSEFGRRYRRVEGPGQESKEKKLKASFVAINGEYGPKDKCGERRKARVVSAPDGLAFLEICVNVNPELPLTYKIKTLSAPGKKFGREDLSLGVYRFRPLSIDLNHETYSVQAQELEKLVHPSVELNGYATRYFNLSLRTGKGEAAPGRYRGEIVFEQGGSKETLMFDFFILQKRYGALPIKAGFIGLVPFSAPYFEAGDKEALKEAYRNSAREAMDKAGFNLFTGVPSPKLSYQGAERKKFVLETKNMDDFLGQVKNDEVFMYNEGFPEKFFTGHQRNAGQSEKSFWKNMTVELEKILAQHKGKKFVWLYSDEATGYRDAVEEDLRSLNRYKKIFPGLKMGGFGNLATWEEGKKLYKKWDYGFFSDIPSRSALKRLKKSGQKAGIYNLCAGRESNLKFCFGPLLYMMKNAGIERYFEWHAAAIHNYPGFDLDGREADIALFLPGPAGEVVLTKRYFQAAAGLEAARKLFLLEKYLETRKAPGLKEIKAKNWLKSLKKTDIFPLKKFAQIQADSFSKNDSFVKTLDSFLFSFF